MAAYRLAHFSDLHLARRNRDFYRTLAMLDHAIEQDRVDHLVITGDLLDTPRPRLFQEFFELLEDWGWAGANRLTYVPGNHDMYGYVAPALRVQDPERDYAHICGVTASTRRGPGTRRLLADPATPQRLLPFPFGKRLAPHVALAGLDSTPARYGRFWPSPGAGVITQPRLDAVRRFLDERASCTHRVVVMHHYPFETRFRWPMFEQNFREPKPADVQTWLLAARATLVLCGHVHMHRAAKLGRRCGVLCAGNSGGHATRRRAVRQYFLVWLPQRGRYRWQSRAFTAQDLDGMVRRRLD